jgi:hypothetical protein
MTTDLERLISLARTTRAVFERVAKQCGSRPDLGGYCYDASCFLHRLAARNGIAVEVGMGNGHYFVLLGDTVVDVTATQFEQPESVMVDTVAGAARRGNAWELRGRDSNPAEPWSCGLTKMVEEIEAEMTASKAES